MEERNYSKEIYLVLLFLAFIVLGFIFKILSSVIIPTTFAVMFSFVFVPLIEKLNKKFRISWAFSVVIISLLLVIAITILSSLVASSLGIILNEYPKYENRFLNIYIFFAQKLNLEFDEGKSFIDNIWGQLRIREYIQTLAINLSTGFISLGKNLFLIIIMFIFLLLEMNTFRNKITNAFKDKTKSKVLIISSKIIRETVRFLSIKFWISLSTGILVFLGCLILRIDFAIVWGFLAFLMNFIPIFGSIISTSLITLFTLIQFYPLFSRPVLILIYSVIVNMVLGNIIEPRIEGKHLGLSPFVILVSLTLWGYIWGFIGLLLAVPMTVILKIICENISYLQPIAILLGSPKKSK